MPDRLVSDPSREAVDSLGGYVYQFWQSLLAWIELRSDEVLFLEGAEDADLLRPGEAIVMQVRRTRGTVTLNSGPIREAINHYWQHVRRNPDRRLKFRYLTTAAIAKERTDDFGFGLPGLQLWIRAQNLEQPEEWEPIVEALRRHLIQDDQISTEVRTFLSGASVSEVRDQLILPIAWNVGADSPERLRETVERAVVAFGRERNYNAPQSRFAIPALLQRVVNGATATRDRFLDRGELIDVFETATTIPVPINAFQAQASVATSDEAALDPLPRLPPRYYARSAVNGQVDSLLATSSVVVIAGSSGVGKTAVAADYAARSGRRWQRLELRELNAQEIEHRLRAGLRSLPESGETSVLIDDLPLQVDTRRFEQALARLVDFVTANGNELIITSYNELPPSLLSTLRLPASVSYVLPMFDEDDIGAFLRDRGAPNESSAVWARIILATTGGHPTLVDASIQALERRAFPSPRPEDIFERPPELLDAVEEARKFIRRLDEPEKTLLYRASLTTHPLRRDQLVALGTANVENDPQIPHPGESVDRLVGPWLESAPNDRLRVSPLASGSGELAHSSDWSKGAHRAMARALIVGSPVEMLDAVSSVLHSFRGEDASTLLRTLESFLQTDDDRFWTALVRHSGWFPAIGIDTPMLPMLDNPLMALLLRSAQYRAARAANDAAIAAKIVQALEDAIPDQAQYLPLRFMFYAIATVHSAEAPATQLERALEWISAGDRMPESDLPFASEMIALLQQMPDSSGDLAQEAGVLVFGRIETVEDFLSVTHRLAQESDALASRFIRYLEQAPVFWRAVVAKMVVDERDKERPNFSGVATAIESFYRLCERIGAERLAIEAIASAVRVYAEFVEDYDTAEGILNAARERYGDIPRLRLAGASIAHARGDRGAALEMFRSAIDGIEYSDDDVEPALDLRMAAIDAADLRDFSAASELLERAAEHASLDQTPYLRLGLLFDAAYAAWRADREMDAFNIMERATDELLSLDSAQGEPAYRNLTRRVGSVAWNIAGGSVATVPVENLPVIGFVSNLDEIADPGVTPSDMITVSVAQMELRIADTPTWFNAHEEHLLGSAFPVSALACHIAMSWAIRCGEPGRLLSMAIRFYESMRANASQQGHAMPASEPPYILLVGAALLGAIGNARFEEISLRELIADARSLNLESLASWLQLGVRYLEDDQAELTALRGENGNDKTQFLAAIIGSTNPGLPPALLVRAYEIWIGHLEQGEEQYPFSAVLLAAISATLRRTCTEQRVNLVSPQRTVQAILNAIENTADSEWQQIGRIVRAASEAAGVTLWDRTITSLNMLEG